MAFEFHSTTKCGAKLRISVIVELIVRRKKIINSLENISSLLELIVFYHCVHQSYVSSIHYLWAIVYNILIKQINEYSSPF